MGGYGVLERYVLCSSLLPSSPFFNLFNFFTFPAIFSIFVCMGEVRKGIGRVWLIKIAGQRQQLFVEVGADWDGTSVG